jgi:menaquinone-dependent protoporphyrinogen oxidase
MTISVLVGYATNYGSTSEVSEAIATTLLKAGLDVDILLLKEAPSPEGYHAVVLGAPLIMFQWHKDALNYLSRHRKTLSERPVAVFALGPVHDPHDEQEWKDSRSQLNKELAKFPWLSPVAIEVFGGKYDPTKLRFPLKLFAGSEPTSDIRDWAAIRSWANALPGKMGFAIS